MAAVKLEYWAQEPLGPTINADVGTDDGKVQLAEGIVDVVEVTGLEMVLDIEVTEILPKFDVEVDKLEGEAELTEDVPEMVRDDELGTTVLDATIACSTTTSIQSNVEVVYPVNELANM